MVAFYRLPLHSSDGDVNDGLIPLDDSLGVVLEELGSRNRQLIITTITATIVTTIVSTIVSTNTNTNIIVIIMKRFSTVLAGAVTQCL